MSVAWEDTRLLLPTMRYGGEEHGGGYGASRNWINVPTAQSRDITIRLADITARQVYSSSATSRRNCQFAHMRRDRSKELLSEALRESYTNAEEKAQAKVLMDCGI